MGRAVIAVADYMVTNFLTNGAPAVRPVKPMHGIRLADARFNRANQTVLLLLDGDQFTGPAEAGFADAQKLDVVVEREAVLPADVVIATVCDLMRNAEGYCTCGKMGVPAAYTCAVCRSKDALKRIPVGVLEDAAERRRQENDPPADGTLANEVQP